jgi:hypothetical protein
MYTFARKSLQPVKIKTHDSTIGNCTWRTENKCSELFVGIENHCIYGSFFSLCSRLAFSGGRGWGAEPDPRVFYLPLVHVTEQSSTGERDGKGRRYGKAFAVSTFHLGFRQTSANPFRAATLELFTSLYNAGLLAYCQF